VLLHSGPPEGALGASHPEIDLVHCHCILPNVRSTCSTGGNIQSHNHKRGHFEVASCGPRLTSHGPMRLGREARCESLPRGSACQTSARNKGYVRRDDPNTKALPSSILLGPCNRIVNPPNHPRRVGPARRVFRPLQPRYPRPRTRRGEPASASTCFVDAPRECLNTTPAKDQLDTFAILCNVTVSVPPVSSTGCSGSPKETGASGGGGDGTGAAGRAAGEIGVVLLFSSLAFNLLFSGIVGVAQ
jgi:hypothetical protein